MEVCNKDINSFCYVCGKFVPRNEKKGYFSEDFINAYEIYFNQQIISGKNWVPNTVCKNCYNRLLDWKNKRRGSMPFAVPMIWTNAEKHNPLNCYACANEMSMANKRKRKFHNYVEVLSAQTPLPHSKDRPVPKFRKEDVISTAPSTYYQTADSSYEPETSEINKPILIGKNQLDSIVAKLELTQRKSEELASILKSNNLLAPDARVTAYRNRQASFQNLYVVDEHKASAYCAEVEQLMDALDIIYKPEDWRLFIDSSKFSLKAVLLHKTNSKPPVPIAYSTETKETYDTLQKILNMVNYAKHEWRICCDLKVVAILSGLQSGYIKRMCFMCDWDSRYHGEQYDCHDWIEREKSNFKTANLINIPLVPQEKILLPPLHIKLGIVKSFIKTIAKRDEVFNCLILIFPKLSADKIRNGVLNGPDIRKLIKSEEFTTTLIDLEKEGWDAIKAVIKNLLGKNRSMDYKDSVDKMLEAFAKIGVKMSLKIHYLHHHLDVLGKQLASESDEHGERYHQVAMPFEIRYKGKRSPAAVLAEICWWTKNKYQDQCLFTKNEKLFSLENIDAHHDGENSIVEESEED